MFGKNSGSGGSGGGSSKNDSSSGNSQRGVKDGTQFTASDGTKHTINSAQDPSAKGGYYHTQVDSKGNKATSVHKADGSLADTKANKSWK